MELSIEYTPHCEECRQPVKATVSLGTDDGDYYWRPTAACETCLRKALALIEAREEKPT